MDLKPVLRDFHMYPFMFPSVSGCAYGLANVVQTKSTG